MKDCANPLCACGFCDDPEFPSGDCQNLICGDEDLDEDRDDDEEDFYNV